MDTVPVWHRYLEVRDDAVIEPDDDHGFGRPSRVNAVDTGA